jgi:hypothetical protein
MKPLYNLILRTTDRLTGTSGNCQIPINTLAGDLQGIKYCRIVSTSTINLGSEADLVIVSTSMSQPYSYSSVERGETQILGVVPPTGVAGGYFTHRASPHDNEPVSVSAQGVLKASMFHLRTVDIITGVQIEPPDFAVHLLFYGDE